MGVVAAVCRSGCNGLGLHVDHYTVIAVEADAVCVCVCFGRLGVVKLRPQRDDRLPLNLSGGVSEVFVRAKYGCGSVSCIWSKSHSPGTFGKWLMLLLAAFVPFVLDISAAALNWGICVRGREAERSSECVCVCVCALKDPVRRI